MDIDEEFKVPETTTAWRLARGKRPHSPMPSTSAASTPYTPEPEDDDDDSDDERPETVLERPYRSVYSNIGGLEDMPQLRGLRSGRRRRSWRQHRSTTQEAKMTIMKYAQAISILEPMFKKESSRLKDKQELIAEHIENFADTVSCLAEQLEGKVTVPEYEEQMKKCDAKQDSIRSKLKALGVKLPEEEEPKAEDAKQTDYRVKMEMLCAIEALSLPDDPPKERKPVFSDINLENMEEMLSFLTKKSK